LLNVRPENTANVISNIHIENYKSIIDLPLDLGRVNVFIGENGAGKSNILEAIALVGAAAARKLDNEFLSSRGIRVVRPIDMRPAFVGRDPMSPIKVDVKAQNGGHIGYLIENDNKPYSKWDVTETLGRKVTGTEFISAFTAALGVDDVGEGQKASKVNRGRKSGKATTTSKLERDEILKILKNVTDQLAPLLADAKSEGGKKKSISVEFTQQDGAPLIEALRAPEDRETQLKLSKFVTFSPENSVLRAAHAEAQIEPLGIKGEGVSKLFSFYVSQAAGSGDSSNDAAEQAQLVLESLDKSLRMLGWFDGLRLAKGKQDDLLELHDFYVDEKDRYFEFASANEGFFFLLFYFLLFSSDLTPPFFAIDNIDTSLNPALCRALTVELVNLAKKSDKQVILTTHNPAVLDGLNLDDDEQRLFVVSRNMDGETQIERIGKPKSFGNLPHLKMSEAFMRGLIGGLSVKF